MLEEGSFTMEKKAITRQSPAPSQSRNGGVASERKSDFTPNRRGNNRRSGSNGGAKAQDGQTPRPSPISKWDRSVGNRRQRQRNGYDYRQREEVEEPDDVFDVLSTGSRKGNLNHLLNFKFLPRRQSHHDDSRWNNRSHYSSHGHGGYRKRKRYKKEQFLQASCQFVVRDTGDYTEQAISSDALVDWNLIELVRSFSTATETVNCPICLEMPTAGKITKCGHTYCWACILHYLKLGEGEARKCPICYETVDTEDLKSVQWIDVPNFKVGDTIDMRLMRKTKGSVITLPKDQWEDRLGKPMNIQEGPNTEYMKLLVASSDQIQTEVIELERVALTFQLEEAEESEACFIQMALEYLEAREKSLKQVFQQTAQTKNKAQIPGLWSNDADKAQDEAELTPSSLTSAEDNSNENIENEGMKNKTTDLSASADSQSLRQRHDSECSLPFGSPPSPFPLMPDQEVNPVPLSLEETADHLELPIDIPQMATKQFQKNLNAKDDYIFYQASTGQQIYLNSLNAQCMAREYGSLEDSPNTIQGSIVAIERIFMTEDVRKRLRYLDHIPLTCEVHIVELKLKPPVVSKETLKLFEAAFDKKRRHRQQKDREDKQRAKKIEIEHRKSIGIYPEVQIPLDSYEQFPSHLSASNSLDEEICADGPPVSSLVPNQEDNNTSVSRRLRNDSAASDDSFGGSVSFAQMLRADKTTPGAGGAWGRACPPQASSNPSRLRRRDGDDDDDSDSECLPAPTNSFSISDALTKALDDFNLRRQSADTTTSPSKSGKGKKKKKEKWIPLL